ncbi:hypothetical protein [Pseudoalteromonas sp. Of7M-16]|uniref:hypothetical protein n=1 Tax=Pseudoalteromonas sp. Of7M-16 TaxID=2917756 RepID=UPI001EF54226|nr:hypothetical protein [Pseudoalteromonas sp. Of7M-16]MCG7550535.1 hypothetical protein [Pseudoalteromonas sp. Of7M-16]
MSSSFNLNSIESRKASLKGLFINLEESNVAPIPPAVIDPENKLPGVTYSIFQMNDAPPELKEAVKIGQELCEKFLSLAGAIVKQQADEKGDPDYVQNVEAWKYAFGFFVDFFQISQKGDRKLKRTTEGVQVARTALDFACNVIASDIGDFQNYLKGVADVLSTEAKKTDTAQTMLYSFCQHNLFENRSGVVIYLPSISFAQTTFSLNESKNLGVCNDTYEVNLDLDVFQEVLTFNINSYLNDERFKEQCDDFLGIIRAESVSKKKTTLIELFKNVKAKDKSLLDQEKPALQEVAVD